MKAAFLSLVIAVALAVTAGSADARPPRYSANHSVPVRTLSFFDEARYGEFLPHSDPRGAFSTYGVAYATPYYRNSPPANPPRPVFGPRSGVFYGMDNGGFRGSRR